MYIFQFILNINVYAAPPTENIYTCMTDQVFLKSSKKQVYC